jgi:hypothetical protein
VLGEAYVKRCYAKYRALYFPDDDLPEFDSLDFEFEEWPDEYGHVEWDAHGNPHLSIHPVNRLYAGALKQTLLHEMVHLALGSKYGHGREFWKKAHEIHARGAYREYFG